jgi:hypothetical protein
MYDYYARLTGRGMERMRVLIAVWMRLSPLEIESGHSQGEEVRVPHKRRENMK